MSGGAERNRVVIDCSPDVMPENEFEELIGKRKRRIEIFQRIEKTIDSLLNREGKHPEIEVPPSYLGKTKRDPSI